MSSSMEGDINMVVRKLLTWILSYLELLHTHSQTSLLLDVINIKEQDSIVDFTIVQIIFHFLWDHWANCGISESRVLLMYKLKGVSSVANSRTAYEAVVEHLPVLHHSADYISFPLESLGPLWYL